MAKSAAIGITGEYISHINAVRFRLNGVGNLNLSLHSLDNAQSYTMKPLPMSMSPGIEPARLANFKSQRTMLRLGTTEMNEYMRIQRIIVFMKPSATSYPM